MVHSRILHSASSVGVDDLSYINAIGEGNFVGYGRQCHALVDELKSHTGRRHATLTSSGTAALTLALRALQQRFPGKTQVLTSAYVCPAVVNAILANGLQPVFVDTESSSLTISSTALDLCTEDTLAVVLTNLAGMPDVLAKDPRIPVICDCAQALGTTFNHGRPLTKQGLISILSFAPTKIITGGLGGAVLCDDDAIAESIREQACTELSTASYAARGFISTMGQYFSDLNAGLVRSQLAKLPEFIKWRRQVAELYDATLQACGQDIIAEAEGIVTNRYRYYFFSQRAKPIIQSLQDAGIDARDSIAHRSASYFKTVHEPANVAALAPQLVSLPIHCAMTEQDAKRISSALTAFFR